MRSGDRAGWAALLLMTAVLGCAAARTSNQGERSAGPPRSSPGAPSADALLDAVVFSAVQDAGAPLAGLAVAVVQRGQVLLRRGYGFADVEGRVPMAANAVFRVGSVTKQFTAAEIMRLVRAGRLSLADSVGAYVAGLPPPVAALTVRQLLNQTTGLANYTALPWGKQHWGRVVPAAELLAQVGAQPLAFAPGARFEYSNSNYYLLGLVIEKLTGRPYADVVRTELAAPAGLTDTAMCADEQAGPRAAHGYRHDGRLLQPAVPLSMSMPFSAGGLCSTLDDLVTWARALAGGRVVTVDDYALMTSPPALGDGKRSAYGFGLFVDELAGHRRIRHSGGVNGFSSQLAHFPDEELTIAVLANTETDVLGGLIERLERAALGVPEPAVVELPLSAREAAPLVGRYTIPVLAQTLDVRFDEGVLRLGRADQPGPGMRLRAQGGGVFAAPDIHALLRFHVVGDHAATVTVEQMGQTFEATRVPAAP